MTSTWMQQPHDYFDGAEVMAAIEESPLAVLLDFRLRLWASSQETAGQITPAAARSKGREIGLDRDVIEQAIGILVDVGLWLPTEGGWLLQDHDQIAERERRIAQSRVDGAKRAAKSRGERPTKQDEQLDLNVGRVTRTTLEGRARTSRDREEKRREELPPNPQGETEASDPSPLVDVDGLAAALDAALHPDAGPLPEPAERALHRHAEQLATIGATPTQITDAVDRYRAMWPNMPSTAKAIVKHWATLTTPTTGPALALVPDPDTAMRERARTTARNLATVLDTTIAELDDLLVSKGLADWLDDAHTEWNRIRSAA